MRPTKCGNARLIFIVAKRTGSSSTYRESALPPAGHEGPISGSSGVRDHREQARADRPCGHKNGHHWFYRPSMNSHFDSFAASVVESAQTPVETTRRTPHRHQIQRDYQNASLTECYRLGGRRLAAARETEVCHESIANLATSPVLRAWLEYHDPTE